MFAKSSRGEGFTEADIEDFIERHRRRDVFLPRSPKTRRITTPISRSEVVGFTALLAAEKLKKQKR